MQFLGMMRQPKTEEQLKDPNDPIQYKETNEQNRRKLRNTVMNEYEAEKETMEEEIMEVEKDDIMQ